MFPGARHKLGADLHYSESFHNSFSCFLWKKSRFYSKMRVSSRAWQLRWCTVDRHGFRSCRSRNDPGTGVRPFNVYQATEVVVLDERRFTFELRSPTGNLEFQAPSRFLMDRSVNENDHADKKRRPP